MLASGHWPLAACFEWPKEDVGQRTSEAVGAGKRAAKHIACGVCTARLTDLVVKITSGGGDRLPDEDSISEVLASDTLSDALGDTKSVCEMKVLASLFRSLRVEVETKADGTAALSNKGADAPLPFYEEINKSELLFHWKSFAVQHACTETFRRDGDEIARGVEAAFRKGMGSAEDAMQRLAMAVHWGCGQAKMCRAARKGGSGAAKKTEL